ncbi:hypothetical protein K493DRAFT_357795 [Basidiobolus meristosporus CBS 931.73]|uniref:Uncharacterized protein n=1 Tax=Basidiobolus meristosporus CBS 931.73 TaxID=1314790 RepID=A0A1Y1XV99_9FUNG|nr:hypothetical protein K493DRAFT_357795 [Basidiobolus meristosporus CBS 931.73]|eukprot:ORX89692.1 hypothetical protein K493DRAFT_357795 [Basidiobolus meristosporus CBS 931.73]
MKCVNLYRITILLFALCAVSCVDREIVRITSPKAGATLKFGQPIDVTWELPQDLGFMNFTAELWSLNTIQAGSSRKIATIGHTDSSKAQRQRFKIRWNVPTFTTEMKTGYFIAVYGNVLNKGPVFSWVYPWDNVYYGLVNVRFA